MELERRNPQLYQVDQDEDEFFDNPPKSSDTIKEIVLDITMLFTINYIVEK